MSQQVQIPAEPVENGHERMAPRASCSNKVGSTTSLVLQLFVLKRPYLCLNARFC